MGDNLDKTPVDYHSIYSKDIFKIEEKYYKKFYAQTTRLLY